MLKAKNINSAKNSPLEEGCQMDLNSIFTHISLFINNAGTSFHMKCYAAVLNKPNVASRGEGFFDCMCTLPM